MCAALNLFSSNSLLLYRFREEKTDNYQGNDNGCRYCKGTNWTKQKNKARQERAEQKGGNQKQLDSVHSLSEFFFNLFPFIHRG